MGMPSLFNFIFLSRRQAINWCKRHNCKVVKEESGRFTVQDCTGRLLRVRFASKYDKAA